MCHSEQHRIKIVEDVLIFPVNTPMAFINDNQVETTYAECLFLDIDEIDHRLVGREQYTRIKVAAL